MTDIWVPQWPRRARILQNHHHHFRNHVRRCCPRLRGTPCVSQNLHIRAHSYDARVRGFPGCGVSNRRKSPHRRCHPALGSSARSLHFRRNLRQRGTFLRLEVRLAPHPGKPRPTSTYRVRALSANPMPPTARPSGQWARARIQAYLNHTCHDMSTSDTIKQNPYITA